MPKKTAQKKKKEEEEEDVDDVEEEEEVKKPNKKRASPDDDDVKPKKQAAKKKAKVDDDDDDDDDETEKPKKKSGGKKAAAAKKGKAKAKKEEEGEAEGFDGKVSDYTILTTPELKEGQIKIISWNVAGFSAVMTKKFAEYVEKENPDIICLQETKITQEKALKSELPKDYHSHFAHCTSNAGYSGVGLMTKTEPISVTKGIGNDEHDAEGRVITAEYQTFYLITCYVPNSGQKLERLDYRVEKWDKDMLAYLKKLEEKKPVIWCGDLNVAHKEIDLKNPKTNKKTAGFTDKERNSFTKILDSGFVDAHRHFYPDQKAAYTYWSYRFEGRRKDTGWRLDYFIVSKDFMKNVSDSIIRKRILGSDHCPILLVLNEM